MTTIGKFVRTTAFKLSAIYLVVFACFAGFLILYLGYHTSQLLHKRVEEAVNREISSLEKQYRFGGISRLVNVVNFRSRRPSANLYLIVRSDGRVLAGNIENVNSRLIAHKHGPRLRFIRYERFSRFDEGDGEPNDVSERQALVRVINIDNNYRILIGRDLGESDHFRDVIGGAIRAGFLVMLGLGLVTWLFVSRKVLRRIDSMAETSSSLMQGDLSGRLEVTGSGDEFDRLADSLNSMLDRLELLMKGLKEVSDNIAHDLKTPLTRLRNRVEIALASGGQEDSHKRALEATIEEADQLIRIFNALLMIARVEAGSSIEEAQEVDLRQVASDIVELYAPIAEESDVELHFADSAPVKMLASRELVGQAISNLIDNALKYAFVDVKNVERKIVVSVEAKEGLIDILVADNGAGIDAVDREVVTERFTRLDASRNEAGSGLGLSLVRAIAKFYGGVLIIDDNDPGLRVCLSLPISGKSQ